MGQGGGVSERQASTQCLSWDPGKLLASSLWLNRPPSQLDDLNNPDTQLLLHFVVLLQDPFLVKQSIANA